MIALDAASTALLTSGWFPCGVPRAIWSAVRRPDDSEKSIEVLGTQQACRKRGGYLRRLTCNELMDHFQQSHHPWAARQRCSWFEWERSRIQTTVIDRFQE